MTLSNRVQRRRSAVVSIFMLLLAASAAIQAQLTHSDCGGEGDRPCTINDPAYMANNDFLFSPEPMACDYGLGISDTSNGGQICKSINRLNFADTNTTVLGRQIEAQEYSVGADTPINWISMMGTHNSFSSYLQGAYIDEVADQYWSMTDQLQAGARNLVLAVHYYDGQMRLCHNSFGSDAFNCAQGQGGRLYLFAIKEIAYWLKQHPGEFVILRLNNTVDDDYDYLLDGPIKEYLGSMAFTPDNFNGKVWPTLRELRSRGKQIIVMGNNNTQWIHSWGRYVVNDAYPNTTGLDYCLNQDGIDVRQRFYNQFAYVAEDRSRSASTAGQLSGDMDAYLFPLLDDCGFSFIDVDFLYSLSKAFIDPSSGPEDRPQASVWSLAPGVLPETQSPMVMTNFKMQPGNKTDVHPFACAGPGTGMDSGAFPAVFYPAEHDWRFTKAADGWKAGETTCQNEFGPTYHFWAPGSGVEYGSLLAAVSLYAEFAPFWVNYFGGPVLTGAPNSLTFTWNKTQAPPTATRNMILRGGMGGALQASVGTATSSAFLSSSNVAMVNSNTASVALDPELVATLQAGTYTQMLQIDETDPATGQINSTHFPVTLRVADSLLLSSSVVDIANCHGPRRATVFVKSGGSFTIEAKDPWVQVSTSSNIAPATLTIAADASGLSAGVHTTYVKLSAPATTNQSVVLQVNLSVAPQTIINSSPDTSVSILIDGKSYRGVNAFCWASGSQHTVAATLSEVFAPSTRWEFSSWTDGGAPAHTITQPNSGSSLTAHYVLQYKVSATPDNRSHGSVRVTPSSGDGYYNANIGLTFTATPASGYRFLDFRVNQAPETANPFTLQLTAPSNVVAEFTPLLY